MVPWSSMQNRTVFGKVVLISDICPICRRESIVIDGRTTCCEARVKIDDAQFHLKIAGCGRAVHKPPPPRVKKRILQAQKNRCFWCAVNLSNEIPPSWDHLVPFSYTFDNCEWNYVATCWACNRRKGNLVFSSVEEGRRFLNPYGYNGKEYEEISPSHMRAVRKQLHETP